MNDVALKALRPSLSLAPSSSKAEAFQNATLRPVLKLQHQRLVGAWHRYATQQKDRFYRLNRPEQRDYLRHAVQTNRAFRSFLLGLATGVFTEVEWHTFRQNEKELARRTYNLIVDRLTSEDSLYVKPQADKAA